MVMDVDRPEPGGAPRVVVVELEHVRGRASGKRRAGATLFCGYRSEWPPLASRPACLPVINETSTLHASNAAGWLAHAPTQTATAGPHVRVRSAPPATVPLCARADDIAPKRRWSTTFARLDHIPARASGNDAVQNELQRSRYRRNSDKDSYLISHLMRGNDISRRDASLAKRNTLFQAYGNIPQVIMIDLARVGSVLNQPAYRQDDSDGP